MLIATVSLAPEDFVLADALTEGPEMKVEAERIAAHSSRRVMPCIWIVSDDFDAVDDALKNDSSVEEIVGSEAFDDQKYYHVEWTEGVVGLIDDIVDKKGSLLHAETKEGRWELRLRFAAQDQLDEFHDHLREREYSFRLVNKFTPDNPRQEFGRLTPDQHDALVTAVTEGYYRIPRTTSTDELATRFGISDQAVTERLRRGIDNLVRESLLGET